MPPSIVPMWESAPNGWETKRRLMVPYTIKVWGRNRMKSLSDMAVVAMVLAAYLIFYHGEVKQTRQTTPALISAPFSSNPVSAVHSASAESARGREKEQPLMFGRYPCGDDCSQHKAGYRWA